MSKTRETNIRRSDRDALHGWREMAPYLFLTAFSTIVALVLIGLMLWKAEMLVRLGLTGKFFFLILVPLALSVAIVLFGILKSYAGYTGHHFGGKLELSGPAVVFVLTLLLGFKLAPDSGNFTLTAFIHGEHGQQELVLRNAGQVMLDLGGDRRRAKIDDSGQAIFPEIPASFRGQTVKVSLVDADGFEAINPRQEFKLNGPSIYLPIRKKPGHVTGQVLDDQGRTLAGVNIYVSGQQTTTDFRGHFDLTIPSDRFKDSLSVRAEGKGYEPWQEDNVSPYADNLEITLNRAR